MTEPRTYSVTGDTDTEWCVIKQPDDDYELSYLVSLPGTYCPPSD